MNNKTYDILAWIGRILLPALAVLYGTVGKIWGLPYVQEVPATITAIALFINTCLKIDSDKFFEGKAIVDDLDNGVGEE